MAQAVADGRQEGTSRGEAGQEHFDSLEKGLREVQRGVQLIRDKQVGSCGPWQQASDAGDWSLGIGAWGGDG